MRAKDFKKLLNNRSCPPIARDKEIWLVPRVSLFFPTLLFDQVKQSLRVNKRGKDKTNIFFQLDWFIPFVGQMWENQNVLIKSTIAMK